MKAMLAAATLAAALTISATALANSASDRLAALTPSKQAEILGQIVGEGCVGKTAFYQGSDSDDYAMWNVRCTNRRSYSVMISPDSLGSTKVLDCDMLRAIARVECFIRFDGQ
jgi:hypothetical protein